MSPSTRSLILSVLVLSEILSSSGNITVEMEMLNLLLSERSIPFLRQTMDGDGNPDALQLKTIVPPAVPLVDTLSSSNLGLTVTKLMNVNNMVGIAIMMALETSSRYLVL